MIVEKDAQRTGLLAKAARTGNTDIWNKIVNEIIMVIEMTNRHDVLRKVKSIY